MHSTIARQESRALVARGFPEPSGNKQAVQENRNSVARLRQVIDAPSWGVKTNSKQLASG